MPESTGRLIDQVGDGAIVTQSHESDEEHRRRARLFEKYSGSPVPDGEQLANLGLFLNRQTFSRMLFMHDMYRQILDVHGVVFEFGVRWGRDLVGFCTFRGMYEPYNYLRRIVGFDTFAGFPSVHSHDGTGLARPGDYSVTAAYESYLDELLDLHEADNPLPHIKKFEIVKGDASATVVDYLHHHPETVVALAYFDMDIYEPTKACLDAIRPHLTRGSVIGFDEVCYAEFPGETRALMESFDLRQCRLHRSPFAPNPCYMVLD